MPKRSQYWLNPKVSPRKVAGWSGVMNITGQLDAAVGLVADVCKKHKANPGQVFKKDLKEYLGIIIDAEIGLDFEKIQP